MEQENYINELETLVKLYAQELDCALIELKYIGLLLDGALLKERIIKYQMKKIYIYGGSYLGIHLYQSLKGKVDIPAIIDKSGGSKVHVPDLRVIRIDEFFNLYDGEYVIATLTNYFDEIKHDLTKVVSSEKILPIGEFLGGMI